MLQQLSKAVGQPLPAELLRFWRTGSRCCDCRYVCAEANGEALIRVEQIFSGDQDLYGGASFIDAMKLPHHISSCREWALIKADCAMEQNFWLNALPFVFIFNGDYLGLDISQPHDDPPVVYLCHDGESCLLATSFTAFLDTWERLCYVGPEIWVLEGFRGNDGLLDADTSKAGQLRELFGTAELQPTVVPEPTPEALEEDCISHLKRLSAATFMYVQDNEGNLPDASKWCTELSVYLRRADDVLSCPAASNLVSGYAMNRNLSGVTHEDIRQPECTVLFYDSDLGTINAHDTGESLPRPGRHRGGDVFVFADSRVMVLGESMQQTIKWTVD